ncbi:MAG TPA: MlaD family protein [bacterium]|nr:MCE family protein [Myxococcales bacterium]HPW45038.1 MlaD family protein [bacterium]
MVRNLSLEVKVGIFAVAVILVLAWATIRVSEKTSVSGYGGYDLTAVFDNATGLKVKAPVELAGVKVGVVRNVELLDSRRAKVLLLMDKAVRLPADSQAVLRTRGFLGDTYVEIIPGSQGAPLLSKDSQIEFTGRTGDINSLVGQFSSIATDVKQMTSSLKTMIGDNQDYPINRIVSNLEEFTRSIRDITIQNQQNIDRVAMNLAEMTDQLREIVAKGRVDVEESMENIASITRKIDAGEGTIGKLVNDDETVNKLNKAVDNLNETLGGFRSLEMEIGYKAEYLTQSRDFKSYVDLALRPSPDKALLLGLVADPDPRPRYSETTTTISTGGRSTTVTTHNATIDRDKIRFSAQLAKSFYDFRIRGGLIESSGGFGIDYFQGPIQLSFSAYDFSTQFGEKPHLKASADLNITPNIYVSGGADDIIRTNGPRPEWFLGAGFKFVDDDFKKYLGASSLVK